MFKVEIVSCEDVVGLETSSGVAKTPFGNCRVDFAGEVVTAVSFLDDADGDKKQMCLSCEDGLITAAGGSAADRMAVKLLAAFFSDEGEAKVAVRCSAFVRKVFMVLLSVRFGERISYSELAARAGVPRAVRAVASAVASNNTALLIPCHRIVRKSGETGEYKWGADKKKALLEWESGGRSMALSHG